MSEPVFTKGFTAGLNEAVEKFGRGECKVSAAVLLGTMTLPDGRAASFWVYLTTDPDEVLEEEG